MWELLRTSTQELRDRLPQLSRDASPALRAGLDGLGGEDRASRARVLPVNDSLASGGVDAAGSDGPTSIARARRSVS